MRHASRICAGNRLADFAGLETRVDRSDRSHAQKIRAVTCQQSPSQPGKAVSTPLDLTSAAVTMVIAPAEWTPANIAFLVSIDGVNFFDLADAASGVEISRALHPAPH